MMPETEKRSTDCDSDFRSEEWPWGNVHAEKGALHLEVHEKRGVL